VLKKRSVVLMLLFTVLTAGFYVPFWFLARRKALNSLTGRSRQVSLGSCITMLVFQSLSLLIDYGVLNLETEFDQSIASSLLDLAWVIILVILSFRIRAILHFVQQYPLSATHTGFLTIFYLQYRMNRLDHEISSSLAPSSTHPREKELTGEKGWWSRNWKWAIPAGFLGSTVLFAGLAMLIFYSGNEVVQEGAKVVEADYESLAISSIRNIATSQIIYTFATSGTSPLDTGDFANDLKALETAGHIDSVLGSGTKDGYAFSTSGDANTFTASASPLSFGSTGTRSFFTDESGVIRYTREDRPATVEDSPLDSPLEQ